MSVLLRTDLELYLSDNNGEVVCGDHTWPSDIHHWSRLSVDEASHRVAWCQQETGGRSNGCEMCDYDERFVDQAWRPR